MYRILIPLLIAALLMTQLSACAVSASIYPVDNTRLEQSQSDRPFYCHVFTCSTERQS
jgi:hypothetical protein